MVTVKDTRLGAIHVTGLRATKQGAFVLQFVSESGGLVGVVTEDSVTVFDPQYPGIVYDDACFAKPLRLAISEWTK